jgi:V/A-type H+-transporting ATPase subunit B
MSLQYVGLKEINGPLVVIDNVENVSYDEVVEIRLDDGSARLGRVVEIAGKRVVLQVFEGTKNLSLKNTKTRFLGRPMEMPLSTELLGRIFNGAGRPIDGLGEIFAEKTADINGKPLNPVSRSYPRNYINTGISSIDALLTLIRGQKLRFFQALDFLITSLLYRLFVRQELLKKAVRILLLFLQQWVLKMTSPIILEEALRKAVSLSRVVMFLNLSNDPIIERILTPRCALTVAEYLAFEKNMHILVILTDMTSYAEAVREFSSSKGEIPGRKGSPVIFTPTLLQFMREQELLRVQAVLLLRYLFLLCLMMILPTLFLTLQAILLRGRLFLTEILTRQEYILLFQFFLRFHVL